MFIKANYISTAVEARAEKSPRGARAAREAKVLITSK